MSRQTDIKSMVSQLMTVYGKKSSTDEYNHLSHIWEKALAKLNEQEIRVGYQNLIKTRVKSGMPSPAEFFDALYNDISDDALMAWNQLFQALKSHPGRPICF
jgi:predicted metalloendopeptidase